MAAITIRRTECVVVVHMTRGAGRRIRGHVRSDQGKPRRAVIERRGPARRCMAIGTVHQRESGAGSGVHRRIRLLPSDQMAAGRAASICANLQVEVSTNMALLARHVGMAQGQRKIDRRLIMQNRRTEPGVEAPVALLALVRGELRRGACMRRRRRVLPILYVARLACCRESQVLPDCGALVTLLAFHNRMRTKQWKSVEVLLDRLSRNIPSRDGVALGAIGAELAAMDIGVAVRAVLADVREDRPEVALRAVEFFVHAAKGITRGVVAEFRNGANRGPARVRVTILAGNG